MLRGSDLTATNVPGPPMDAYFAGAKIESLHAFGPPAGAALNAALVTMAGRPCVGLNIDPAAIPDPAVMTMCVARGFDEVIAAAEGRCTGPEDRGEEDDEAPGSDFLPSSPAGGKQTMEGAGRPRVERTHHGSVHGTEDAGREVGPAR